MDVGDKPEIAVVPARHGLHLPVSHAPVLRDVPHLPFGLAIGNESFHGGLCNRQIVRKNQIRVGFPDEFIPGESRHPLGGGVDIAENAPAVDHENPNRSVLDVTAEAFLAGAEAPLVPPLPLDKNKRGNDRRRKQHHHRDEQDIWEIGRQIPEGFFLVHFGLHDPRRVFDRGHVRENRLTAIINTLARIGVAEEPFDGRQIRAAHRKAQVERGVRPVAEAVEKDHFVAITRDKQCLRRLARQRPVLQQGLEEIFGEASQDEHARRFARWPSYSRREVDVQPPRRTPVKFGHHGLLFCEGLRDRALQRGLHR